MKAARDLKAKQTLQEQKKRVRYAQYALLAIGIIQFIFVALLIAFGAKPLMLIIDIVLGVMFFGLYFLSKEKPGLAFNIGAIVYGILQLLAWFADAIRPAPGVSVDLGLLIKFIIMMTLFSGIAALKRIPKSLMDKKETDILDDLDTGHEIR